MTTQCVCKMSSTKQCRCCLLHRQMRTRIIFGNTYHIFRRRVRLGWEELEEPEDAQETQRNDINRHAPSAEFPARRREFAGEALVQDGADADDVAGEQAADVEGDKHGVGEVRADGDEVEYDGEDDCYCHCVYGAGEAGQYVVTTG